MASRLRRGSRCLRGGLDARLVAFIRQPHHPAPPTLRVAGASAPVGGYLSVSVKQFLWHVTAVIGDLPQDGAVQPHVHLCRAVLKSRRRAQLLGEFSSSTSTAIDVEQLEQVDDRGPPVELRRAL